MGKKSSKSLIDPTRLDPIRKKDGLLQVIVETPKGEPAVVVFALGNGAKAKAVAP